MLLTERAQRILRLLHIFAASYWSSGVLCIFFLVHMAPQAGSDEELFGMLKSTILINQYVLIPLGAFGTFFTGLAYSLCTQHGFFRHRWILCKWCLTLSLMLFGVVCLGPWAGAELDEAYRLGLDAYAEERISLRHALREAACLVYSLLLLICMGLSVFRPWEEKASR